ncbi:immunity protein [Pediococcus inopinatus]|uniref:immunity protein n=1 Tax=Pediococcus inopinatus TaxID=114090 RepID=UPI002B257122|nr:immunity protein [Pediococcus inopinatus]WPC16608.1 immunity protein [Pediococcus inopinatus]
MITRILIGTVSILIGLFQFYNVYTSWKTLRVKMTACASVFMPFALWYSIFFGLLLIGLGVAALL